MTEALLLNHMTEAKTVGDNILEKLNFVVFEKSSLSLFQD